MTSLLHFKLYHVTIQSIIFNSNIESCSVQYNLTACPCRKDALADLCSGEFSVASCRDPEWKLPTPSRTYIVFCIIRKRKENEDHETNYHVLYIYGKIIRFLSVKWSELSQYRSIYLWNKCEYKHSCSQVRHWFAASFSE
jgi:hypothetical protein